MREETEKLVPSYDWLGKVILRRSIRDLVGIGGGFEIAKIFGDSAPLTPNLRFTPNPQHPKSGDKPFSPTSSPFPSSSPLSETPVLGNWGRGIRRFDVRQTGRCLLGLDRSPQSFQVAVWLRA